eukprot:2526373-Rhodomonas_salina.3
MREVKDDITDTRASPTRITDAHHRHPPMLVLSQKQGSGTISGPFEPGRIFLVFDFQYSRVRKE